MASLWIPSFLALLFLSLFLLNFLKQGWLRPNELLMENQKLKERIWLLETGICDSTAPVWYDTIAGSESDKQFLEEQWPQVHPHVQEILGNDRNIMSEPFPNGYAALWWRLTRLLFAAHLLPIDAAGGKHRKHRLTMARKYVNTFMQSDMVQDATKGASHCAEVGDKHFLNTYLNATCLHKYAIDIKDKNADVLMNLLEPDWSLPGVIKGKYDVIVMNEVLEHIQQPETALQTISDLLAPNGILLMTTPFMVNYHENPADHNRYTPSNIRLMLAHVGLKANFVKHYGNWLTMVGYAAGFAADELVPSQFDDTDWLEGNERPYQVTVAAIGRKP